MSESRAWAAELVATAADEFLESAGIAFVTLHALSRTAEDPLRPRRVEWPDRFRMLADIGRNFLSDLVQETADAAAKDGYAVVWYQQATLTWSLLESLVEDLVHGSIERDPSILARATGRVPTSVLARDRPSQLRAAARFLVQEAGTGKRGLERFEASLRSVDMDGAGATTATQHAILKLQLVRNLVGHRHGKVDEQFISEWPCEAREHVPGRRLVLDIDTVFEVGTAVSDYLSLLEQRYLPSAEPAQAG